MRGRKKQPAIGGRDASVRRFELLISWLLRTGVWMSLIMVLAGLAVTFTRHASYLDSGADLQHLTAPGAAFPHTWPGVVEGIRTGHGQAIVALGLLILIGTPILRVAVSIIGFILQRDRVYVLITATVLALLLISFLLGKAG